MEVKQKEEVDKNNGDIKCTNSSSSPSSLSPYPTTPTKELPPPPILAIHGNFRDRHGRVLMLRGVNLSGSVKIPTRPNGATHLSENFYEMKDVSFVGRPFPLEEADEHFRRLHVWGLRFLRFLVTWEAIEHEGCLYIYLYNLYRILLSFLSHFKPVLFYMFSILS